MSSIECVNGDYGYDYEGEDEFSYCGSDCNSEYRSVNEQAYYFGDYNESETEYDDDDESDNIDNMKMDMDIDMDVDKKVNESFVNFLYEYSTRIDEKFAIYVYDFSNIKELAKFSSFDRAVQYLNYLRYTSNLDENNSQILINEQLGIVYSDSFVYEKYIHPRLAILDLDFHSKYLHSFLCQQLHQDNRVTLHHYIQNSMIDDLMSDLTL